MTGRLTVTTPGSASTACDEQVTWTNRGPASPVGPNPVAIESYGNRPSIQGHLIHFAHELGRDLCRVGWALHHLLVSRCLTAPSFRCLSPFEASSETIQSDANAESVSSGERRGKRERK